MKPKTNCARRRVLVGSQFVLAMILATAGTTLAQDSNNSQSARPTILFIGIDDMNDWTTLFDDANPIPTLHLS